MDHGDLGSEPVVHQHRVQVAAIHRGGLDQHDGSGSIQQRCEDHRIGRLSGQNHTRHMVLDRETDVYRLAFGIVVGVGDHHRVVVGQGNVVETAKNRCEERVLDVGGDERPVPCPAGPQCPADRIATVTGPFDGRSYSSRLDGVDGGAVQHARHCRRRYVGRGSDLAHRRHGPILDTGDVKPIASRD